MFVNRDVVLTTVFSHCSAGFMSALTNFLKLQGEEEEEEVEEEERTDCCQDQSQLSSQRECETEEGGDRRTDFKCGLFAARV